MSIYLAFKYNSKIFRHHKTFSFITFRVFVRRGGVLEPEGMVQIKFRKKDQLKLMHRLDPKLKELQEKVDGGKLSTKEKKSE